MLHGLLTVLPFVLVMIAGPQIVSAVFLATSVNWARNSLAYIAGASLSITAIVTITYFIVRGATGGGAAPAKGDKGIALDVIILVLLLFLAVNVYRNRNDAEPPKWMGRLQQATPGFSFKLGFLLLGVFPTDIVTSVTVGTKLARADLPWWPTLVFVAVTLLVLAIPALLVAALGERARTFLPRARDWMNSNSWIVSEIVLAIFIVLEVRSLLA